MPSNSGQRPDRGRMDGRDAVGSRAHCWMAALGMVMVGMAVLYCIGSYAVLSQSLAAKRKVPEATPRELIARAEPVRFQSTTDGTPLSGWLLSSSDRRAIVLVHGVDSHGWDGSHPDLARAYTSAGFSVLTFDLRGHGRSGGDRLGFGWKERDDVRAAVELLLSRGFRPGSIGIHGTSYGAAAALLAAAEIPELGAVVADSAFADIRDLLVAQVRSRSGAPAWLARLLVWPGIQGLAQLLYGLDFDKISPGRAVPAIAPRPILFIHGARDNVIPVSHAHRLWAASRGPADDLWTLRDRKHTECIRMGARQEALSPFREQCLARVVRFFDQSLRNDESRIKASRSACPVPAGEDGVHRRSHGYL